MRWVDTLVDGDCVSEMSRDVWTNSVHKQCGGGMRSREYTVRSGQARDRCSMIVNLNETR